jgi:hypothetical protein
MLEREAVKSAISGVLDAAERGRGRALFVLGDPGMGKSEVLDHACATARSFLIRQAAADVMEASLPFALAALLDLGAGTDLPRLARDAACHTALDALAARAIGGPCSSPSTTCSGPIPTRWSSSRSCAGGSADSGSG